MQLISIFSRLFSSKKMDRVFPRVQVFQPFARFKACEMVLLEVLKLRLATTTLHDTAVGCVQWVLRTHKLNLTQFNNALGLLCRHILFMRVIALNSLTYPFALNSGTHRHTVLEAGVGWFMLPCDCDHIHAISCTTKQVRASFDELQATCVQGRFSK